MTDQLSEDRPLDALNKYVVEHTDQLPRDSTEDALIDMHFFKVQVDESFDAAKFRTLFYAVLDTEGGEFAPMTRERVSGGPSYIEWGGWIGDQGLAMRVMAAGMKASLWSIVTPKLLGMEGAEADQMAGSGFVMTSGLNE